MKSRVVTREYGVRLDASRIAFGKCCNRARDGLLRCFISITHAKVTRALIFSLGGVFVSVCGLLGDEQATTMHATSRYPQKLPQM